jgi:hypothetical protein
MFLPCSSIYCTQDGMVKTSFGGPPPEKGLFFVNSFIVLTCNNDTPFPWKSIWQAKIPLWAVFLASLRQ